MRKEEKMTALRRSGQHEEQGNVHPVEELVDDRE
jgi:hypothetical protein